MIYDYWLYGWYLAVMDEIDDMLEEAMDDSNYEGSVDYSPHKPKGMNSCIFWKIISPLFWFCS